ncbi:hypothetical protein Trydic_g17232 [Trypoxylus dichotomus]
MYRLKKFVQNCLGENPYGVPRTLNKNRKRCLIDQEKVEVLSDTAVHSHRTEIHGMDAAPLIVISSREILDLINGILQQKTPSEDYISNRTLKNLSLKLVVNLTTICNAMPRFRTRGKSARIISLRKSRKNHHTLEDYRPILLPDTISKVLETLQLARINYPLGEHHPLHDDQFGFKLGQRPEIFFARGPGMVVI